MFKVFYENLKMSQRSADVLTWVLIAITVAVLAASVYIP